MHRSSCCNVWAVCTDYSSERPNTKQRLERGSHAHSLRVNIDQQQQNNQVAWGAACERGACSRPLCARHAAEAARGRVEEQVGGGNWQKRAHSHVSCLHLTHQLLRCCQLLSLSPHFIHLQYISLKKKWPLLSLPPLLDAASCHWSPVRRKQHRCMQVVDSVAWFFIGTLNFL